jgi:hypothetical protein
MRERLSLALAGCAVLGLVTGLSALRSGPRAAAGLTLDLTDFATMPVTGSPTGTGNGASLARVNVMREEPGGTGRLFQFLSLDSRNTGILDLTVDHNTGFSNAWSAYTGDKPIAVHRSFTFRNNIAPKVTYGFAGGTKSWPAPSPVVTGDGSQTLHAFYLAPVFTGNVLAGSTPADYSGYPGNFFPATDAEVGFVDLVRGNYRLAPASPYKKAASDGKDPGAAIDALEAATAGAVSGKWPPVRP